MRASGVAGRLFAGCLLFGGCSQSPLVDRLVSMEPELTDIEIESAERIARYADESDQGFLNVYHASHVQVYAPHDDYHVAVEELRAAVEATGWELERFAPFPTGTFTWCTSKPDPEIPENLITVHIAAFTDPFPDQQIILTVAPEGALCPPETGQ